VPAIIRLLKPGERRTTRGNVDVVKEGRYVTDGFGLFATIVNPPYTTLTAYDLNAGTIKWQIGLGDDLRLVSQGIKGTGTAGTTKGGIIVTATGLLFVSAADQKVHIYDTKSGTQIHELALGGTTSGSPSMYELGGRQYLLATSSPGGVVAYALPRK
jgi:quinoprotein glucose dehydrogenase